MKDHVREERWIDISGTVDGFIEHIRANAEGLVEPIIEQVGWSDDCFAVVGWRPMNERELEQAKKRRKQEREAKKRQKEAQEAAQREQYERLKAKFES